MDTPKLYIGNLAYSVTDDQLKKKFEEIGTVDEAVVITNKYTGRSKGFGFITFASAEDAKRAVETFHEQDFEGRKMIVSEARPKREEDNSKQITQTAQEPVLKEGEPTAHPEESEQKQKQEKKDEAPLADKEGQTEK